MAEKILHMMVGLPRSGKSTEAQAFGYPVVCPDAIRLALHGTLWRPEAEPIVWGIARTMVEALFLAGHTHVVLDACNHTQERRRAWESEAWVIEYHVITTDVKTCVSRARAMNMDNLIPVIRRMGAAWDPPGMEKDC